MEIYDRVKQIRKENNLSQTDFGDRLGVTRSVINNIENNRLARPEQKTSLIKLISKEFSINEEWLLTGKGDIYDVPIEDERLVEALIEIQASGNEKLKKIVENMMKLDDRYVDIILNLVDTVLENKK